MRPISRFAYGFAAVGLGLLTACGDSTSPKANSLTQAEAQTVAANLFTEISAALSSRTPVTTDVTPSPSFATTGTTLNYTVSGNCTEGGSVTGTYSATSNLDGSGNGTIASNAVVTIAACAVNTGTRTIAVSGNLTYGATQTFANGGQPSSLTATVNGNYAWEGGSCSLNYNITVTPAHQMTFAGNICGVSFNASAG